MAAGRAGTDPTPVAPFTALFPGAFLAYAGMFEAEGPFRAAGVPAPEVLTLLAGVVLAEAGFLEGVAAGAGGLLVGVAAGAGGLLVGVAAAGAGVLVGVTDGGAGLLVGFAGVEEAGFRVEFADGGAVALLECDVPLTLFLDGGGGKTGMLFLLGVVEVEVPACTGLPFVGVSVVATSTL